MEMFLNEISSCHGNIILNEIAIIVNILDERVGNITLVLSKKELIAPTLSQMTLIIRGMYSNPPNHGARVVAMALNDPVYFEEWRGCIKAMSDRIKRMRQGLRDRLEKLQCPGDWAHVTNQIGMFSYTGLNREHLFGN
jgi:aspartate aminotransferase